MVPVACARPSEHLRCSLPSGFGGSFGNEIIDALEQLSRPLVGQNASLDCGLRNRPEDWGNQGQDHHRSNADR
jgi:hypothetical protein